MRVRPGGSHHQKIVVIRHPDRPDADVAFVGGIDLCHSRRDDADHDGDDQAMAMPDVYGDTPPWHDMQIALRGPAVGDVERTFRERWTDPHRLTHNPVRLATQPDQARRRGRRSDPGAAAGSGAPWRPAGAGAAHVSEPVARLSVRADR